MVKLRPRGGARLSAHPLDPRLHTPRPPPAPSGMHASRGGHGRRQRPVGSQQSILDSNGACHAAPGDGGPQQRHSTPGADGRSHAEPPSGRVGSGGGGGGGGSGGGDGDGDEDLTVTGGNSGYVREREACSELGDSVENATEVSSAEECVVVSGSIRFQTSTLYGPGQLIEGVSDRVSELGPGSVTRCLRC